MKKREEEGRKEKKWKAIGREGGWKREREGRKEGWRKEEEEREKKGVRWMRFSREESLRHRQANW